MKRYFYIGMIFSLVIVLGCSSKKENKVVVKKVKISGGLKGEGHKAPTRKMPKDKIHMSAEGQAMALDGGDPPLKKMGIGSAAELKAHIDACVKDDPKGREALEKAFRLAFTPDRSKRDIKQAATLFTMVLGKHPHCALAHRGLAYIAVLDGFRVQDAIREYKAAVQIDPKYGEALYGLATLMLNTDAKAGIQYFKKAMELGIPDEHGLKAMYNKVENTK